ncbi:CTD nuclear envelope phosphatase 1 [Chelonia mydas]|uniref:Mitochondrial import inner membrane translocase subunit TIM50 n=1 Tax=Chelonia mydas TaxID=8469 RepID=M7BQ08_CHEMY|nr:CTD nuclear envelope phosphatase 1 [Chelonia mydas]
MLAIIFLICEGNSSEAEADGMMVGPSPSREAAPRSRDRVEVVKMTAKGNVKDRRVALALSGLVAAISALLLAGGALLEEYYTVLAGFTPKALGEPTGSMPQDEDAEPPSAEEYYTVLAGFTPKALGEPTGSMPQDEDAEPPSASAVKASSRNPLADQVKRKVLVLDLDETLIHSHHDGVMRPTVRPGTPPDFILKVVIDKHPVRFFVHKRPHVDFFLEVRAATVNLGADGEGIEMKPGENRSSCPGLYAPPEALGQGRCQQQDTDNAIPIKSWFSDPSDTALLNLLPMLDALRFTADVRSVLSRNLHQHRLW